MSTSLPIATASPLDASTPTPNSADTCAGLAIGSAALATEAETLAIEAAARFREPVFIVRPNPQSALGVSFAPPASAQTLIGQLPALYPEWLGDRGFCELHRLRFPYVAGAMANGIATTRMVIAIAEAGMLGFFGSAGLRLDVVERAISELQTRLGERSSWGSNLIHSPNEPALEAAVVDLYLRHNVRHVSASAYMALTPNIVRYSATGLWADPQGTIRRTNHVFAKVSRPEVAAHFMAPAPAAMLAQLVGDKLITAREAELAQHVSIAEDLTVESDSGGHTDNRPLGAIFPTIANLRDRLVQEHHFTRPIRLGAAGGLGTPRSVAAAFALGAAYVLTGSINQGAVESGLCSAGREQLAQAGVADVIMAPAADMFEMGVKVQVLKRGTMFANRARKLYDTYCAHRSLESIPTADRQVLERTIFGKPLEAVWEQTAAYWRSRDANELARAEADPHHQMALCFRWYLGQSSRWAIAGTPERKLDYQIWCGPAMGAFNSWAAGSFLQEPENRTVAQIARNLLEGAATVTRAHQLRNVGVAMPAAAFAYRPRPLS